MLQHMEAGCVAMTSGNTGITICGGTDAGITPGNDGMAEAGAVDRALCTCKDAVIWWQDVA